MENFINYCKDYWQYLIALVIAVAVLVFVCKKAAKAHKDHYKNYHEEEAKITRLVALKEQYKDLTETAIKEGSDEDLLEGVALSYQLKLQKLDNIEKEFASYNIEKRYIYALDVFCQSESVSKFFRENGRELTEIIVPAIEYTGLSDIAKQVERLRIMFDEKDETTSINNKVIDEVDNYAKENNIAAEIRLAATKKIKADWENFVFAEI